MYKQFKDRAEGGKILAEMLLDFKDRRGVVLLALPRGGVPVGIEVAKRLKLPLFVFLVRKLGVPAREELAFGAVASGGITVINESIIETFRISKSLTKRVLEKEKRELEKCEKTYRSSVAQADLEGKSVIVIDDGIATGATMRAALAAVRKTKPREIIVAAPVASEEACQGIRRNSNDVCICVTTPSPFYSVGMWYKNFEQVRDREVSRMLAQTTRPGKDGNVEKIAA